MTPGCTTCGYAIEWLRSCYASSWRLFRNSATVTNGYYYFADKNAPHYPALHNLGSRNWISDESDPLRTLGEITTSAQTYYKGSPPGGLLPDAKIVGSADCIAAGDNYPPPTGRTFIDGVDILCWTVPPVALTVKYSDGSVLITSVSTIEIDQNSAMSLTDVTPAGQSTNKDGKLSVRDASIVQSGVVNLTSQVMGAGAKFFTDKVGVGTQAPLANSALDVRGYTYSYFAGIISFGGGNSPASEAAGAILQHFASGGSFSISLTIAAAAYTAGRSGGILIDSANNRLSFRHRTAAPKLSFLNDDTSVYTDGQTGSYGGVTYTGGLATGFSGTVPAPTGGPGGILPPHNPAFLNAAGTTQAGATTLTGDANTLQNVSALNTAFKLPPVTDASVVTIAYPGAGLAAQIFPPVGGQIRGLGLNTALALAAGSSVMLTCTDPGNKQWW